MSLEDNKALVRRMLEWWPAGDVSGLDETCAEVYVLHARGKTLSGLDAIKARLRGHIGVFNERKLEIEDIFAERDRVAVRYVWSGVMKGSGRHVALQNMHIFRLAGGKIVEEWEEQDTQSLSEQTDG
jgi:ketosteroid isomerase-like protein